MIDLKLLQKDFDGVSAKLMRKGVDATLIEKLKLTNEELKKAKSSFETLQALQNSMSKEFGVYKREGKDISHKVALSKGGSNADGVTVESRSANRSRNYQSKKKKSNVSRKA